MTDTVQAVDPPQTNGIDAIDEDERAKNRPADIDADVKEMERRKRVENIMNSRMFREELERIIETQMSEGTGTNSLMQQISDMMGVNKQAGNFYKNSSCVVPINDIRGVEAMSYGKGEKILRCKLAAVYRLIDLCGWSQGISGLITARLNQDEEHFLVNPYGMLYHEITASSLIKVDMQANVVEQGTTNFSVNISAFSLHGAIHAARPDIKCIIHLHTPSVVAISATKHGILPVSQESVVIGEVSTHPFLGGLLDPEEKDKLARNLGPNNKVLLLTNQGVLCCGETIEEAFFNARNTVLACEAQLKLLPIGLDNLILLNEETRKRIYEAAHKAPESSPRPDKPSILEGKVERKWRVGGVEFEGLMRMLDNVGFRTGYIYRHPLVKGDVPKPKNDVEVPPAVSSLGYLLEEEELYKKGLWRNLGEGKKGQNRSRWLNSPNVYQRVEILETGTQDPKKITKWVAEGSPTHSSTPIKIENALQFVPKNTNPKEFKLKQQQIKDYRRADKISAGPQSYILDTLTWEEAKKMQDASLNQTGDQVVLMGAASKGIIQRGHQHNAMVYKSPYAKNPFDSVTDEELDEYKKVVEKKVKGDYDTDFSESELSSAAINKRMDSLHHRSPTSETEEESRDEPQVLRIETTQAPRPSQPEVVLSDGSQVYKLKINKSEKSNIYRTNSHHGLPKGSFLVPNPVHFHIAHEKQIALRRKPHLTALAPFNCSTGYLFNHNRSRTSRPVVTINYDNTHSVSLNIPIEILRGFILPFATALNLTPLPTLNTQASQTTYMNNFQQTKPSISELRRDYTPLVAETSSADYYVVGDNTTSFEAQILDRMQCGIMNMSIDSNTTAQDSMNLSCYEEANSLCDFSLYSSIQNETTFNIDDDIEYPFSSSSNTTLSEVMPFHNIDDVELVSIFKETVPSSVKLQQNIDHVKLTPILKKNNESVGQTTDSDTVPNFFSNLSYAVVSTDDFELGANRILWRISEASNEDKKSIVTQLSDDILSHTDNINDTFTVNEFDEMFDTFDVGEKVEENKTVVDTDDLKLNLSDAIPIYFLEGNAIDNNGIENCSEDEGIEDYVPQEVEKKVLNNKTQSVDEGVKKLSDIIYEYLQKQCFEIREIVLFPEVLHDPNLNKLLAKLKTIYDEFYNDKLSNEEKNELRLSISSNILDYLETDEHLNNGSNDSSLLSIISDKMFSIAEFVSDILDNFFNVINCIIVKEDSNGENFLEFTKPLRDTNGNLLHSTPESPLNISQNTNNNEHSQIPESPSPQTPPPELSAVTAFKKSTSKKSGVETFWISCSCSPEDIKIIPRTPRNVINVDDIPLRPPEDLLNNSYSERSLYSIQEEPRCNLFQNYEEESESDKLENPHLPVTPVDDILAGGDGSYINFDKPDVKIVLHNEVKFFRFHSIDEISYVKAESVILHKSDDSNESFYSVHENNNDDDEGDWMGYEMAKF